MYELRNKKQETRNKKQETRNKKQETRNKKQYPATIRRSIGGVYISASDMYLDNIGKTIANTVLARYYKGLEGDNSNAVLVVYE